MKNLRKISFLLLVISLSSILPLKAQTITIFGEDKPMVQALWHRMADYTTTLRSVESAEISPDGRLILSSSKFGYNLMLWTVADGKLLWEKVLDAEIEAVTFSPDGKYIAAGDEAYLVTIYDLEGNSVKVLHHDAGFDGITWSPDGKYVAGGSEKGEVVLWNADTWGKEIILDAGATVNSLEFTKDSKKLIAAGNKRTPGEDDKHGFVKSWDVANNWEVIFEIKAQEKSVKSVRLSPDEKTFAISGAANQVKIFSYPEAKELAVIDVPDYLEAVAYHPEGNFIFAGGHGRVMHVYNTGTYKEVLTFPCRRVEYIDFSEDGRLMVTAHEDSGLLSLYFIWLQKYDGNYGKLAKKILKNKDLQNR
jgi:WD40 repeat protein